MLNSLDGSGRSKLAVLYNNAASRLILLDYDGTLIDFKKDQKDAIPSEELSELLCELANHPQNKVFIITGRNRSDIESRVGHLPIGIIAEHGAMIKETGQWEKLLGEDSEWKSETTAVFLKILKDFPNTYIEEKDFSTSWHFTKLDSGTANNILIRLKEALQPIADRNNLKMIDGKTTFELISKKINKGSAALYLIEKYCFDFILAMGDDRTDEDMFEALADNQNAYTIKIGNGNSAAKFKLKDVQKANQFLGIL
jgi:trehalose 6-phosphate synthase/phosphatase